MRAAASRHGAVLIPSFAVERTQEILVDIVLLMEQGVVPHAPIFIDSPLALKATEVFSHHAKSIENGEALMRALDNLEPQVHRSGTWPSYANPRATYVKGDVRDRSVFEPLVLASQHLAFFGTQTAAWAEFVKRLFA